MYYVLHCVQLIYSALLPLICIAQQLFRREKKNFSYQEANKTVPYLEGTTFSSLLQLSALGKKQTNKPGANGRRWQSQGKAW